MDPSQVLAGSTIAGQVRGRQISHVRRRATAVQWCRGRGGYRHCRRRGRRKSAWLFQLTGRRLAVCLLESGGIEFARPSQSLYSGRNVGMPNFALEVCQIRYFGGAPTLGAAGVGHSNRSTSNRVLGSSKGSGRSQRARSPACVVEPTRSARSRVMITIPYARWPSSAIRAAKLLPFDPARLETTIYRFSPHTRIGQVYREALRRADDLRCYLMQMCWRSRPMRRRVRSLGSPWAPYLAYASKSRQILPPRRRRYREHAAFAAVE